MRTPLHSRRFITLAALCLAFLSFTLAAHANTPAAPPAPTAVAPQNSTPAPVPQPAPTEPPATVPAARREEGAPETPPAVPAVASGPAPGIRPTVFQRAASYLQGREALATEITSRDRTITDLRSELAQRDTTIGTLTSELTELRAGRDQLQTALTALESRRATVASEVAALGFPSAQLPATLQDALPPNTKALAEAVRDAKTPVARMKAFTAWQLATSRN